MKLIFWAVLITVVDVPVGLSGGGVIDLVPDWLGLAFLSRSAGALTGESIHFRRLQRWSAGVGVWAGCAWLGRIALGGGVPLLQYAYNWLLLWLLWLLVEAFRQTEQRRNVSLGAAWLRRCWAAVVVCTLSQMHRLLLPGVVPLWLSLALTGAQILGMGLFLWGIWRTDAPYRQAVAFSRRRN